MKTTTMLLAAAVLLAGCSSTPEVAPASDAAISACYESLITGINSDITIEQYAQTLVIIRLGCEADSKLEPGPFSEKYGD